MSRLIKEMSWVEFDRRRKESSTVIIPSGAVEVYGPHMPMGSDIIMAEEIALRVAERIGAIVAPKLEMGDSSYLTSFPGTMVIGRENFQGVVEDTVNSLIHHGLRKFLFISGHAGNLDMINAICKKYIDSTELSFAIVDWWRFAAANSGDILDNTGVMAHGHAAECGTSCMLYVRPDLVHMEIVSKVEPRENSKYNDIHTFHKFMERTPSGIIGDPTCATSEKGEMIVNRCVDRIVSFVMEEFQ